MSVFSKYTGRHKARLALWRPVYLLPRSLAADAALRRRGKWLGQQSVETSRTTESGSNVENIIIVTSVESVCTASDCKTY